MSRSDAFGALSDWIPDQARHDETPKLDVMPVQAGIQPLSHSVSYSDWKRAFGKPISGEWFFDPA